MSRFFLHIRDGDRLVEDPEGDEFPTIEAARVEAVASARDLLGTRIRNGEPVGHQHFEIEDEAGNILAVIPFRSVVVWE